MPFYLWSKTPAANATADPTISWAEGMSPSSVNDSSRAEMARLAEYRDDIAGAIVTGGTSSAFTLASNQVFDTLAHMSGAMICFTPHITNAVNCTLNVDGLGGGFIRSSPGVNLGAGVLVQGSPYAALYNQIDGCFYLRNFYGNPFSVPLGSFMFHSVAVPPNSNFVMPIGQAISRTVYATYFAMVGTTFGAGDGVTTFNVPDLRSRILLPLATMGGADPGLVTTAGSGVNGAAIGAVGGAQNVTLDATMIPAHTHTFTGDALTPHSHTTPFSAASSMTAGAASVIVGVASTSTSSVSAGTPAGTNSNTGGGLAHNNMPPVAVLPLILRIF